MQPYKLSELIDIPRLQALLDDFYTATTCPSAVLDSDNTILTASGWQEICTDFHRVNPDSCRRCQESDSYISQHLDDGESYVLYECELGLVDVANPIIVNGTHVGTVFTGQFLFAPPDTSRFIRQAQTYGFDEPAYLAALERVPVIERDKITPLLNYLSRFTEMLAEIGYERLQQMQDREALQHAREEQVQLQAQLLAAQQATISELSAPILPIADGLVVLPLIGTIDSTRAQHIMETLLQGVAAYRARNVIIDITGVKVVDTQVALALIGTAQAVKLLGAEVVLTGVKPQIAQTLIHLGTDIAGITTRSTLQAGIAYALNGNGSLAAMTPAGHRHLR